MPPSLSVAAATEQSLQ